MEDTLSMILDVAIFMALVCTIFYAIRLHASLNRFRRFKSEFESLIREISADIDKAQETMAHLKATAQDTGAKLQATIQEAQLLINHQGSSHSEKRQKTAQEEGFSIHDREFEEGADPLGGDQGSMPQTPLQSRAEKDLLNALNNHNNKR